MTFAIVKNRTSMEEFQRQRAEEVVARDLRPLRKLGMPGRYRSKSGRFTIVRDPTGGENQGGWGYSSWLVFDESDDLDDGALNLNGQTHAGTLSAALWNLALEIVRGRFNPSRACPGECDDETFNGPVCEVCLCCRLCATTYTFAGDDATKQCPGCKLGANSPSPNMRKDHPENALNYACPSCKAPRFKPCVTASGAETRSFHAPRFKKCGAW